MICSIMKMMASRAIDSEKPLPKMVTKHAAHCEKCRIFVEIAEKMEMFLPLDAKEIAIPAGLKTESVIQIHHSVHPILLAAAAVIAILLTIVTMTTKSSLNIDTLTSDTAIAMNEILNNPGLAEIMTGSVLQDEMDALMLDSQAVINSLRTFAELTP